MRLEQKPRCASYNTCPVCGGLKRTIATMCWRCRNGASFKERFWRKVRKGSPDECWEWTGGRTGTNGHGQIRNAQGDKDLAHRLSWQLHYGPIPDGLLVLHSCDNPICVNPKHLHLGTASDNIKEAYDRGLLTPKRGVLNGHAKLTGEQVMRIRYEYAVGQRTQRDIARELGVSQSAIMCIVTHRTWAHLP